MMDREVQRQRHMAVKNYIKNNKDKLFSWAYKNGLKPRNEDDIPYIGAEIIGRCIACKAIRVVSGFTASEIEQQPIDANYDMRTPTDTHIEVKFKFNDGDEYPTDDITLHKKELNEGLSHTGATQVIIPAFNGVVRCYNMFGPATTGTWTKNKRTVVDSEEITEEKLVFNPKDALWEVTITMPNWDEIL